MLTKNSSKKPIIGITLDWDDKPTYSSSHPWYALRTNYASCISNHGAIPITLPYEADLIDEYLSIINGLVVTGGDYDLSPKHYGEEETKDTREIKNTRTNFEMKLLKEAINRNMPILAICAGEQLLNVLFGGKLFQDIKTFNPNALDHEQKNLSIPMSKPSHKISIIPNTLLHRILKKDYIEINSSHHQAVSSVGPEVIVSAVAEDGIIEAIEIPKYNFVLGVEWHPEFEVSSADSKIIQAFIAAAKNYRHG